MQGSCRPCLTNSGSPSGHAPCTRASASPSSRTAQAGCSRPPVRCCNRSRALRNRCRWSCCQRFRPVQSPNHAAGRAWAKCTPLSGLPPLPAGAGPPCHPTRRRPWGWRIPRGLARRSRPKTSGSCSRQCPSHPRSSEPSAGTSPPVPNNNTSACRRMTPTPSRRARSTILRTWL